MCVTGQCPVLLCCLFGSCNLNIVVPQHREQYTKINTISHAQAIVNSYITNANLIYSKTNKVVNIYGYFKFPSSASGSEIVCTGPLPKPKYEIQIIYQFGDGGDCYHGKLKTDGFLYLPNASLLYGQYIRLNMTYLTED